MKNKWLIIFCIFVIILIATSVFLKENPEDYYNNLTYQEVKEKIKNNEKFILYVKQTDCKHCQSFTPKFTGVLSKYNLKANVLNLTDLTEEDRKDADLLLKVSGTPTVLFYENGSQIDTKIEGSKDKKIIIQNLKQAGYIK